MKTLKEQPVTILLCAAFVLAALAGGVLVIVHPATLSFNDYLSELAKLATALGILGVGRGIHAASKAAHPEPNRQPIQVDFDVKTVEKIRAAEPIPAGAHVTSRPDLGLGSVGAGEEYPPISNVMQGPPPPEESPLGVGHATEGRDTEGPGDSDLFPHIDLSDPSEIAFDQGEEKELSAEELAAAHLQVQREHEHSEGTLRGAATSAVSGLSTAHRKIVRAAIHFALGLSVAHSAAIGYTQGSQRWEWFSHKISAAKGQFPRNLDCSAWATWILYQGLKIFGVRDLVNGENWGGGFTGTMLNHGKLVKHRANVKLGDLAIYNGHVAVCIGGGYVLSHGSPGIHKLEIDYRGDLICIRRYI